MPRIKYKLPSYCRHKASGQAVVTLHGRDHYLGPFGSAESQERYNRLMSEWSARRTDAAPPSVAPGPAPADLRIAELLVAYLEFAERYYVKNGSPTGEYRNMQDAARPLSELYASLPVKEFGPTALKAARGKMIETDLSRKVINSRINRIRRIFKWAVENQMVDPGVLHALQAVAPLKKGRCSARETKGVTPLAKDQIDAVLPHVTRPVKAMIQLQLATGMRPGEVVQMRMCDLDTSCSIWAYRPASHKTEHHGIERIVYLGPRAQEILKPFLRAERSAHFFDPRDAVVDARGRIESKKKATRRRFRIRGYKGAPTDHYTRNTYHHAIFVACKKAGICPWGPNRLRHNAATSLRKEFGLEAARVVLGHASAAVTEVYAEVDRRKAAEIMGQVG